MSDHEVYFPTDALARLRMLEETCSRRVIVDQDRHRAASDERCGNDPSGDAHQRG